MKKTTITIAVLSIILLYFLIQPSTLSADNPEVCLDCHEDYLSNISSSSMIRDAKMADISCASCHVNYEDHIEDPLITNITNPSKTDPYESFNICSSCHFGKSESHFAHAGSHLSAGVNCSGCHRIHNNDAYENSLLTEKSIKETCFKCHGNQQLTFTMLTSHPVENGTITCVDCHDYFNGMGEDFTSINKNAACYKCHNEMDGPFMYEHEATRDFGLEDGGCINCHKPHGSEFTNLLREPVELLCQQCHVVSTAHASAHNAVNCLDCHIDIHGSDSDSHFLSTRPNPDYSSSNPNCIECHQ